MMHSRHTTGYITVSVLVFAGVFVVILGGLTSFLFIQNQSQIVKQHREQARQIAEGGLDYYKWFLAHFPTDPTDGPGMYELPFTDPETGTVGRFALEITGDLFCGQTNNVEITSTGWTDERPDITRTLVAKYARPSVAEYAFVIDSNVWAGSDRTIIGPYHSNGGIRMDGTNESLVTSAVDTWTCTSSFGCNPASTTSGVFGAGSNDALWQYPVPQVDFGGITLDLVQLKGLANTDGLYIPETGVVDKSGIRLRFNGDGTVTKWRVKNTTSADAKHTDTGSDWHDDWHTINQLRDMETLTIPVDCPVIFVEGKTWVEGVINGKVTLAVSEDHPNKRADVIINDNITYTTYDGSDGLAVVGERSILLPVHSPNDLTINGIFIAQGGYFGRNYYPSYETGYLRNSFTLNGTVVSSKRVGTKWTCGGGTYCSGYNTRTTSFDHNLATEPPPFTPSFSDEFTFVEWREEN